ncbi:preprotein translocase subunit YajC [Parelusimicrobium proximum]|uniref:preprotein translocase subunit YajC n=1 Tax=Parelusimicrobium proximum TaxID=3228953 RepID=UPI003D165B49
MDTAAQGSQMGSIFMMVLLFGFVVYLFFSIRGQKNKETERQQTIKSLQKGDKVVIFGGIVGTVDGFKGEMIDVKISEGNKVTVLPSGILSILNAQAVENKAEVKK